MRSTLKMKTRGSSTPFPMAGSTGAATTNKKSLIKCEIVAISAAEAAALSAIAETCARDVGQRVEIQGQVAGPRLKESVLTFHLPVELAVGQSQIWCLACRLACFCPKARICVLVLGESAFTRDSERRSNRKSA